MNDPRPRRSSPSQVGFYWWRPGPAGDFRLIETKDLATPIEDDPEPNPALAVFDVEHQEPPVNGLHPDSLQDTFQPEFDQQWIFIPRPETT